MSTFITSADYESQIKGSNLQAMIGSDSNILELAEGEAVSQVQSYLFELYDVTEIFSRTGANRHPYLLRVCKDIVLYILHMRLPNRQVPESVAANYADCLRWLEKVNDGAISLPLPRKTETDADGDTKPKTRRRFGSLPPRSL